MLAQLSKEKHTQRENVESCEKEEEARLSGSKFPSRMATEEELAKRKFATSWKKPRRKPSPEDRKMILGLVMEILIRKSLKNHCYQVEDKRTC